jgi:hypothetical protein
MFIILHEYQRCLCSFFVVLTLPLCAHSSCHDTVEHNLTYSQQQIFHDSFTDIFINNVLVCRCFNRVNNLTCLRYIFTRTL